MKRIGWAAFALGALAGWPSMAQQAVDIVYVPKEGPRASIYANGTCAESASAGQCEEAKAIAADVQEVYDKVGQQLYDDPLMVQVYEKGHTSAPASPAGYRWPGAILLRHDWSDYEGAVHHEAGHAWVDKITGIHDCGPSSCPDSEMKHRGVSEGIAKIIEREIGGGSSSIREPSADTVDAILAACDKTTAYRRSSCAHDLGNLVVKRFDVLKEFKGADYALDVYLEAVRNLDDDDVTPYTLMVKVAREIAEDIAFPTVVSADEMPLPGDSLPVAPATGWFIDPHMFVCRIAIGTYHITCTRRADEPRPGEEPPH